MCGRFVLAEQQDAVARAFNAVQMAGVDRSYNIAPTQSVSVVRFHNNTREVVALRWGLIPSWSKEMPKRTNLINARAETVATKPSFRVAYKRRRCLIPTNGFYEWQTVAGQKQPVYIHFPDQHLFAFAGLWECWHTEEHVIESCIILTTEANREIQPVHHRMPVILDDEHYGVWLGEQQGDVDALLCPLVDDMLTMYPVSTYVNSPRNNSPDCFKPCG